MQTLLYCHVTIREEIMFNRKTKQTDDNGIYGNKLLHAVIQNNTNDAKEILEATSGITWATTSDGNSALHYAADLNNAEMVTLLIKHGADITLKNAQGKTPIQLAADKSAWSSIDAFVNCKHDDKNGNAKYGYALLAAVRAGRDATVAKLLDAGVQEYYYRVQDEDENSPLHLAVQLENIPLIELLLERCALLVTHVNNEDETPIILAAKNSQWKIVDMFGNDGYVRQIHDEGRYSIALTYAVKENNISTVSKVLENDGLGGGDDNYYMEVDDNPPFHHAVLNNNVDMIKLLLDHSVDPYQPNNLGVLAIQLALDKKQWECVDALAVPGINLSENSVLINALKASIDAHQIKIAEKILKIVKGLIKAGTNPDLVNPNDHNNLLHYAVIANDLECVKLLIKYGAKINDVNFDGNSPLHLAAQNGLTDIVSFLLSKKANISLVNNTDKTALQLATEANKAECMAAFDDHIKNRNNQNTGFLHAISSLWKKSEGVGSSVISRDKKQPSTIR